MKRNLFWDTIEQALIIDLKRILLIGYEEGVIDEVGEMWRDKTKSLYEQEKVIGILSRDPKEAKENIKKEASTKSKTIYSKNIETDKKKDLQQVKILSKKDFDTSNGDEARLINYFEEDRRKVFCVNLYQKGNEYGRERVEKYFEKGGIINCSLVLGKGVYWTKKACGHIWLSQMEQILKEKNYKWIGIGGQHRFFVLFKHQNGKCYKAFVEKNNYFRFEEQDEVVLENEKGTSKWKYVNSRSQSIEFKENLLFPKKSSLNLNLIPASSCDWDQIRKQVYQKAGYTCEICGVKSQRLDCNELWDYKSNKQILVGLEAICRDCHLTQHMGYASTIGSSSSSKERVETGKRSESAKLAHERRRKEKYQKLAEEVIEKIANLKPNRETKERLQFISQEQVKDLTKLKRKEKYELLKKISASTLNEVVRLPPQMLLSEIKVMNEKKLKQIKELLRSLSRKKHRRSKEDKTKPSNAYLKIKSELKRMCQRLTEMIKKKDAKGRKRKINQQLQFTTYKAKGAGKWVEVVNPYLTSKRCSECKEINKELGDKEIFKCPNLECDNILDRDINASRNILYKGIKKLEYEDNESARKSQVVENVTVKILDKLQQSQWQGGKVEIKYYKPSSDLDPITKKYPLTRQEIIFEYNESYLIDSLSNLTYHEKCFRDFKMREYLGKKTESERKDLGRTIKCKGECGKECNRLLTQGEVKQDYLVGGYASLCEDCNSYSVETTTTTDLNSLSRNTNPLGLKHTVDLEPFGGSDISYKILPEEPKKESIKKRVVESETSLKNITTSQEYLNQKYPTREDKEKVKELNQKYPTKEDKEKEIEGGELDLREFKNIEEVSIDGGYLKTPLTKLNLDGLNKLTMLDCNRNNLISLDVSGCVNLTILRCFDNNLTSLNLDGLTNLTHLYCLDNNLTSIDFLNQIPNPEKLEKLVIFNNNIQPTDISIFNLTKLTSICIEATDVNEGLEYLPTSLAKATRDVGYCLQTKDQETDKLKKIERLENKILNLEKTKKMIDKATQTEEAKFQNKSTQTEQEYKMPEINYNKDTKDNFRELIEKVNADGSPKNPEARKFFLDNLREFSLWDKSYTLVLWEFIYPGKSEVEFEKELIATEPKKSEAIKAELVKARDKHIQVYNLDVTAFMDEFFPNSRVARDSYSNREEVVYPRRAKELDISQEEVNKLASGKVIRVSGAESNISINIDLTEKIDLSKNKRLKELFMNSSPYITEVRGKQMNLDRLVLSDEKYEVLTTLMMYGSAGTKTSANYLKLNKDHQLIVKIAGQPDTIRFAFNPRGDNNRKVRKKFVRREPDEKTADFKEGEEFNAKRGDIEYEIHDGDIQLASRLNPPELPPGKVETIIISLYNAIKKTVEMSADARKAYTDKDMVKGVEDEYKDMVRGEEKVIKLYMPKRETTKKERESGKGVFTDEE
ncbi:10324_t:CDS:10 [Funneliformis geosporum]|nr:10324_t:CDS:10 [Funneliformis geosporum]